MTDLNLGRFFSEKNVKFERLRKLYKMKWSEHSTPNYFKLGVPLTANNFLFAFNYVPPEIESGKPILFVHSAPVDLSKAWLSRLMVLYPESEFIFLKSASAEFSMDSQRISFVTFPGQRMDENYFETIGGGEVKKSDIGLVFFGMSRTFRDFLRFYQYANVVDALNVEGIGDKAYGIDSSHRVFALDRFLCWTEEREVKGMKLHLPLTLHFQEELEEYLDLAAYGPAEGAIVSIGNFLCGSTITLAKGSKSKGREKVYSFDINRYNWKSEMLAKNGVEDWIVFQQIDSNTAAEEWGKRNDTRIRLLIIDADHSYEACKTDIVNWSRYLVAGGVLAAHDYCDMNGLNNAGVVRAVNDTVLQGGYTDYRQNAMLFLARKEASKS